MDASRETRLIARQSAAVPNPTSFALSHPVISLITGGLSCKNKLTQKPQRDKLQNQRKKIKRGKSEDEDLF